MWLEIHVAGCCDYCGILLKLKVRLRSWQLSFERFPLFLALDNHVCITFEVLYFSWPLNILLLIRVTNNGTGLLISYRLLLSGLGIDFCLNFCFRFPYGVKWHCFLLFLSLNYDVLILRPLFSLFICFHSNRSLLMVRNPRLLRLR